MEYVGLNLLWEKIIEANSSCFSIEQRFLFDQQKR